jgi:hypothetical protein
VITYGERDQKKNGRGIELLRRSHARTGEMSRKLHAGERLVAVLRVHTLWKEPGLLR